MKKILLAFVTLMAAVPAANAGTRVSFGMSYSDPYSCYGPVYYTRPVVVHVYPPYRHKWFYRPYYSRI